MKRVVINGDGERLGTVTDDPFELTTAPAAGEDFEAAFDGVAEATDADTAQPPVNPGQLAAELFTDENPRRRRELIRSVARANDWALVDPGDLRRADTEELANRYQEGDVVQTPDSGVGVIAGAVAEDQTAPDDSDLPDIEASPDSPTYVVVTEDADQGMSILNRRRLRLRSMHLTQRKKRRRWLNSRRTTVIAKSRSLISPCPSHGVSRTRRRG